MIGKRKKKHSSLHTTGKQVQHSANPIYRFLTSMKVGVVLLILLTLACVLGTFVPQNQEHYQGFFGRLFVWLGLTNVFSSWWFNAIAGILALSLTMCSWRRLKSLLRPSRRDVKVHESVIASMRAHVRLSSRRPRFELEEHIGGWLEDRHYHVTHGSAHHTDGTPSVTFLLARKGYISQWGTLLTHIGLLIIMLGAMYGNTPTLSIGPVSIGPANIGKIHVLDKHLITDRVILWRTRAYDEMASLAVHDKKQKLTVEERSKVKAPFTQPFYVALLKAEQRLSDEGMPTYFGSTVQIMDENFQEKSIQQIEMNKPAYWNGVSITMNSYMGSEGGFAIRVEEPGQEERVIPIPMSESEGGLAIDMMSMINPENNEPLAGRGWTVFVSHNIYPAIRGADGKIDLDTTGHPREPKEGEKPEMAFGIFFTEPGKEMQLVGYLIPGMETTYDGVTFGIVEHEGSTGATLSLRKDPGIPIVYVGFGFLTAGVLLAFYISQRTIRVRMSEENGRTQIIAGARSRGGMSWAETELDRLSDAVKGFGSKIERETAPLLPSTEEEYTDES
jgi:cytochrome c biogenesis protein ResB